MTQSLLEAVDRFSDPHDEHQLREFEEAMGAVRPDKLGKEEFRALLGVFERFPEDNTYWRFLCNEITAFFFYFTVLCMVLEN